MNVEGRYTCSVFSRVREINASFEMKRRFSRTQSLQVADLRVQRTKIGTCRDRYNLVSFGAVEARAE